MLKKSFEKVQKKFQIEKKKKYFLKNFRGNSPKNSSGMILKFRYNHSMEFFNLEFIDINYNIFLKIKRFIFHLNFRESYRKSNRSTKDLNLLQYRKQRKMQPKVKYYYENKLRQCRLELFLVSSTITHIEHYHFPIC